MTKHGKTPAIARCRSYGFDELDVWALLMVVVVIQIACAFGARGDGTAEDSPQVALTQGHDGTLLAKR